MILRLVLILLLTLLTSCSFISHQYGHTPKIVDSAQLDTYHQVLQQLGAPDSVATKDGRMAFIYQQINIDEPQLAFSLWPSSGVQLNYGNANAQTHYVFFVFDSDGNTTAHAEKTWHHDMGDGLSVGLFFQVEETVDQARLQRTRSALQWGRTLLDNSVITQQALTAVGATDTIGADKIELIGQ
ncbi:hypothetical protein [Sinobacterium norvegicum]|nr:hypothetical protein [Sinobacterium norvegicum]